MSSYSENTKESTAEPIRQFGKATGVSTTN